MSDKWDKIKQERAAKHDAFKAKFGTERDARAEALKETQAQARELSRDARGFAHAVALRRGPTNAERANPPAAVETKTVTTGSTTVAPTVNDARGDQLRGIPVVFYCYVRGKIGTVTIYCMAAPTQEED